jgi:subtilase family serine protease
MRLLRLPVLVCTLVLVYSTANAASARKPLHGSVSPNVADATDDGRESASTKHELFVGLALRNGDALEAFLQDVQDPSSPRYGRFLSQDEFNQSFAPTPQAESALVSFLDASGLTVTDRYPNRLLVGITGSVNAIEHAFGVEMHKVNFRGKPHFAAFGEPSLPSDLADSVVGVLGLDDLTSMQQHARPSGPVAKPAAALGSNCCHLSPNDLTTFYDDTSGYDGSGQTIVIAGAYAWRDTDNASFSSTWGLPALPSGSGQVCTTSSKRASGCAFSSQNSIEVALDVEYTHGTAPRARILNYMAGSTALTSFTAMYNRIVNDNPGHVVTTSWGSCEAGVSTGTQATNDNIFANANAVGQSWFAASGDSGSRDCGSTLTVDHPANSPHVVGVGGTHPTCSAGLTSSSPACAGYGSETGWSGSGGGVSQVFSRPLFQTSCGIATGSKRLVPDVALEADTSPGNYVVEGGNWYIVGGTSDAAPQWAGLFGELNQKKATSGLGNPGTRLYQLCGTAAYHDVTSGSNGDYSAAPGYDLVTGLGTPDAQSLLTQY